MLYFLGMGSPHISVIIPLYNEEDSITSCLSRLTDILKPLGSYEVLCINDGSTDQSEERLLAFEKTDKHVRHVNFLRNFGHQAALSCGYREARDHHLPHHGRGTESFSQV